MPGPAPKSKDERRRTNKPVHEWVVLSTAYDGEIPPLPAPKNQWKKDDHEWWESIWRTPMATQWQPGDVPALIELAKLRQAMMKGEYKLASEVRQRSDKFGLTPRGRRDLRWIITEEDAERAGLELPGDQPIAAVRRLHAIDPSGS
jgi:hypothetical protein